MSQQGEGLGACKRDDAPRLMLGASLTVAWAVVVDLISADEVLTVNGSCLSANSLYLFNIGALAIVVWMGWLASRDSLGRMLTTFVGDQADTASVLATRQSVPGRVGRLLVDPWLPVTGQFVLAGWLIYSSGGLAHSPYAQVPLVMMAIGQSLYATPFIRLSRNARLWNVPVFLRDVLKHYFYPISLFMMVMGALFVLRTPPPVRAAPNWEMMLTTLLGLVVSMSVVAATRWRDKRRQ